MDKNLKKGIKQLLLWDSILSSSNSLSRIMYEVEKELEDIFGKPKDKHWNVEEYIKIKSIK